MSDCPEHDLPLQSQTVSQMVDSVLALPEDTRLMILAPVAREKKGEFLDVFAEMQAQGYVRFRVNGQVFEYDDLPKLKKNEKHDIDVVIDRVKVRPEARLAPAAATPGQTGTPTAPTDALAAALSPAANAPAPGLRQRLAESFEAALRLAQGRAIALEMDSPANAETGKQVEHLFNAKFACPLCHYSISELEPRLFSFNSPVGACPGCDGLGSMDFFDSARVVAFPSLSLASGAIKGWDRRNGYYFAMLESLARHYKFDVEAPFESLPLPVQQAVLQGSGEEEIKFSYVIDSGASQGKKQNKKHAFEGVIPNMQRRYHETDSVLVREDLARYRSTQPCTQCAGTRLRNEARHVRLGDGAQSRAIFEISHATLGQSWRYFNELVLQGSKGEIARKIVQEIASRLKFLNDVGLNYLSLDRSAETLSGGESQRIRLASQIGSGLTGVMYVLDEPSIGLHQRDNDRLIGTLQHLRDIGNSVLVAVSYTHLTLRESLAYFNSLQMAGAKGEIAAKVVREIGLRLKFLNDVGLNYLSLDRSAETLSGGESQRIRLASQIGSGLTGVMYVLDEPSIGLHQRDNERLIDTLKHLRDIGNSVLVVEHDEDMMRAADHVIDMGLGAGIHGGRVIAQGSFEDVKGNPDSLTGKYLAQVLKIEVPKHRSAWLPVTVESKPERKQGSKAPASKAALAWAERHATHLATQGDLQAIRVVNASGNNLRSVSVTFPVGLFTCVTGVSGSGKSTLVNDTLYKAVARSLYRAHDEPAAHEAIEGIEHFDKVINVDQSPIGRTPRSNPATYTGLFTPIRELMAEVPVARERGYGAGRFSFNVTGGRCEACQGDGMVKVEMHFLPDVYVPCDVCAGKRYNRETLEVLYKGKNIAQILDLTVEAAHEFFKAQPTIARKLHTLLDVGLSYIRLGQAATTLSGGEAQRVKLALELSKRDTGRTLYILDEPTTGLHFADIDLLLKVLHQLRDAGNTIVVIEHNLDVIKTADWLIDMGIEGGAGGGQVVGIGTPEDIAANPLSHTGLYLKRLLPAPDCHPGPRIEPGASSDPGSSATRTVDCGSSPQ